MHKPILFSGSSHPDLASEVSKLAGIEQGNCAIELFPDKEIYVQLISSVYDRDVVVLQSLAFDPNHYLMELLILLDALKRASARSITVVISYLAYARQDRMNKPGTPITSKLVANLLTEAGADRMLILDLHAEQIEGFFDIPVEHLLSRTILIPYCASLQLENAIVVAPDKGGIKIASDYAKQLNLPMAMIDKKRIDAFNVETRHFVGDVAGRIVIIPDDMCSTGGTIVHAALTCAELGARVMAIVGHGLFIENALEAIEKSPIEMIITTNSVKPQKKLESYPKVKILSIAPLIANALKNL